MTTTAQTETLGFQAEVRQLLDLMIHSLYSNKEIFLRELVSNASDACDKLRFEALSDEALYEGQGEFRIEIAADKDARTVTIRDNGIGMSRAEVIDHIGTIAKSGTRQFFASLTGDQQKDARLIGQFGVGFYSAFIVASEVTLLTRRAGLGPEHGVRWRSDGQGSYTVENVERAARGTEVTLKLREGEDEFLDPYRLQSIVRKYSDHIAIPIVMAKPDGKDEETVNSASALWTRPRQEIAAEQYEEFYKHVAHDFEAPLAHVHARIEGKQEYTVLLYVPNQAPFDLWDREHRRGVKLYVRRVFIMDDAEQLLPPYLRFVRGVVDSNDLPLNVSREILQKSRDIDAIRGGCVRKVLDLLEELAKNDAEKYARFWKEFGRVFKEGVVEDHAHRARLSALLRFTTTRSEGDAQSVSLADYVAGMSGGQKAIYYLTAESLAGARSSPHLEIFRKKNIEVLLLTDRIDEWVVMHLTEYGGKPLRSVAKGALDLDELADAGEKAAQQQAQSDFQPLLERLKKSLGERVKDVRITHRLTDSPSCIVTDEHDLGANLERILKAAGQSAPASRPILEINPGHPLVERLRDEADEAKLGEWGQVLLEQAQLTAQGSLADPSGFVRRVNALLTGR
jgi:molecular chaperone HtpG